jgi:histo-blood group ABO system transferase
MKIGLLIIATGKYDRFVPPLHESVLKHFMHKHDVTVFVFTDKTLPAKNGLVAIHQDHEPWPNPTLKRYHVFDKHKDVLSEMDYLYYCDADMLFVSEVGDEILPDNSSDLVATEHPGFHGGRRGTYETRYESTAYVSPLDGDCYYAGGFNGGTSAAFLKMAKIIRDRVDKDLKNDIIALWHDESQLNRYMIDYGPKVLSPSYCYPESWDIPFEKKLLALDKNHEEMRNQE